jgi:Fe-S cluster assembly iron-binding protein IscA
MLMLTETAGEYLTTLLENTNAPEETTIRFVLEGSTLTPKLDNTRPGDATFDHDGRRVLVLDSQVSQILAESTLDVQATDEGPKLVLLQ